MTRDTSMPEETTSNNMQVVMETEYQQIKQQLLVSSTSDGVLANRMGQREKMHNPGQLMELAKHIESAQSHVKAVAGGKLELISEQIKALQAQAREVLESAKVDLELSRAKCNFKRIPGRIYHLYEKTDRSGNLESFFSMLSPKEWGGKPPHTHLGSFRLEYDMSWTPTKNIPARDAKRVFDPVLLGLTNADIGKLHQTQQLRLT
eukprot:m.21090 g.21090  ORF g.21090 m.21090 type:complete len:205 (-) comp7027_c0_seq2:359-973(-)